MSKQQNDIHPASAELFENFFHKEYNFLLWGQTWSWYG